MQTETTKLIIHTGAGPKGIAGEATGKNARRGWQAMKARSVSRVRAGKVVVWSAESGQAAHAAQRRRQRLREGVRCQRSAVVVEVEVVEDGRGAAAGRARQPLAHASGAQETCTPSSLLSKSSTMPYLRYFIM